MSNQKKVGFTGTRQDTTPAQFRALCMWVTGRSFAEFYHGCCVGADADAFDAFHEHAKGVRIVAHPPTNHSLVSLTSKTFSDEVRPALPYLDRNRAIVDACDVLVACPKGPEEQRSGTWFTVRYARRQGKPVVIVWPDGEVTEEKVIGGTK